MKNRFRFVTAGALLLWVFAVSYVIAAPVGQEQMDGLTVWTYWPEADLEVLNEVVNQYQEETGIVVEIVPFDSPEALLTELITTTTPPDVFTGLHTWGAELLGRGIEVAYCVEGGCPECETSNPPEWCKVAMGDFSESLATDFSLQALCVEGVDCCSDFLNALPSCTISNISDLDIFQASLITLIDDDGFPTGTPQWWETMVVLANPPLLEEQGLSIPATTADLGAVIEQAGVYFDPAFLNRMGIRTLGEIALPQDPIPTLEAGLLLVSSDEYRLLNDQLGGLEVVALEDYRPEILVHGVFMDARSDNREAALNFIYEVTEEEVQQALYERSGHLPADGRVLEAVTPDIAPVIELARSGRLLFPAPAPVSKSACADFTIYADNFSFTPPNDFFEAGIHFISLGGMDPFVNQSGNVIGLQFSDTGLWVEPPGPASGVYMTTGAFANDFDITAYDSAGSVVDSTTILQSNSVHPVLLVGSDIVRVEFTGGSNEGVIVNICFSLTGQPERAE